MPTITPIKIIAMERATLDISGAAQFLSLGRSSIYKLIRQGDLRSVKIAGRRLVPREQLEALVRDSMSTTALARHTRRGLAYAPAE